MAFEIEVKKHLFSKAIFYIDEKVIRFGLKEVLIKDITGFSYVSTQTRVNGINASKMFQIFIWQSNRPDKMEIRFTGTFGGGQSNDKFDQIIEQLWHYFGNSLLDQMHKHLMGGKVYQLTPRLKVTSTGIVVSRKPWFSQPYEVLGKWNDLTMNVANGYLSVRSKAEKKAKRTESLAQRNLWVFYYYVSWVFKNPDVIASLSAAPDNYKLLSKRA